MVTYKSTQAAIINTVLTGDHHNDLLVILPPWDILPVQQQPVYGAFEIWGRSTARKVYQNPYSFHVITHKD
jgi:hypothetical protein